MERLALFFRNKRGVRQGDPISPLLFDFMADALSALIDAAARAGHLRGVVPHLSKVVLPICNMQTIPFCYLPSMTCVLLT
jgi:hypothetical protein